MVMMKRSKGTRFVKITAMLLLGLISVASIAITLYALRANNVKMLELRDAVIAADESGIAVYERLGELQQHVAAHMNATPPRLGSEPSIQLKNSYDRARAMESARVSAERTNIANEATQYCESSLQSARLSARASCVADYIAARPVQERPVVADLYRYDFVSPRWTPDLAGIMLVVAIVSTACFVATAFSLFSKRRHK
jgi:hypothetical protein